MTAKEQWELLKAKIPDATRAEETIYYIAYHDALLAACAIIETSTKDDVLDNTKLHYYIHILLDEIHLNIHHRE